jgi:hypothetical protein
MNKSEKSIVDSLNEMNQAWIKLIKEISKLLGVYKFCEKFNLQVKEKWKY